MESSSLFIFLLVGNLNEIKGLFQIGFSGELIKLDQLSAFEILLSFPQFAVKIELFLKGVGIRF